MSCSGGGLSAGTPGWAMNSDNFVQATYQQPGECSEGYLARAGNVQASTGSDSAAGSQGGSAGQDPTLNGNATKDIQVGGPPIKNTIQTISIPVNIDLSMNTSMEMSPESDPVDHWTNGTTIPGITFNQTTGAFSGTVTVPGVYSTTITAYRADGTQIDQKVYQIVASKVDPSQAIKFIHPLPGSVVTSPCTVNVDGTLYNRILSNGVNTGRPHTGIDLAYPGRKIGNVIAAASGTVLRADDLDYNGYGNFVVIGHENAAGKKLCVTCYAHLHTMNVQVGQKVSAGDVIGVEGKTGHNIGAEHLHFEIRSPEFASGQRANQKAAVYDPAKYISGVLEFDSLSGRQAVDNGAYPDPGTVGSNLTTVDNGQNRAITPLQADNKCSGYVPDNSNPGPGSNPPTLNPPTATGQCFTDAMAFVMLAEVGPWFDPTDPVTINGDISTTTNKRKVGYVIDSGGETKYGISKNGNPGVDITTLNLAQANAIYQEKYWNTTGCANLPNPLCIVQMNTAVNSGPRRASEFLQQVTGTNSLQQAISVASKYNSTQAQAAAKQYVQLQQNFYNNLASANPGKYGQYLSGWTSRCNSLNTFCAASAAASA